MFEGYVEAYAENARLAILRGLAEQNDYRLSDSMLVNVLAAYAINRGRDFVRAQLAWLEHEAGAISTRTAGTVVIAELTDAGLDHVERRRVLPGVKRPEPTRA